MNEQPTGKKHGGSSGLCAYVQRNIRLGLMVTMLLVGWHCKAQEVMMDLQSHLGTHAHVRLQKAAEYHGRYYCAFHYYAFFPRGSGAMMVVVDGLSGRWKLAPLPVEHRMHYLDDLFVRHDTLFYHHYGSWTAYDHWFDTVAMQWRECGKTGDLVHEDADYRVYAMNHGEWGQCTWFIHCATGRQLVMAGIGWVCRAGDDYYLVEPAMVRRVSLVQLAAAEPSALPMAQADTSHSMEGYIRNMLLGDTVYRTRDYDGYMDGYLQQRRDTMIVAPFVEEDSLRLIVDLPTGTAVMRVSDGCELPVSQLETITDLGYRCKLQRPQYTWRGMMQEGRLLLVWQEDEFEDGLLLVDDGQLSRLQLRHNIDTLPVMSTDGLDSLLPFLASGWGNLKDNEIRNFLMAQGTYFCGEDSLLRNAYFEEDAGIDERQHHCDRYIRRVDTLYRMSIEVCLRNADSVSDGLFVDFGLPETYVNPSHSLWDRLGYEGRQRSFQRTNAQVTARLDTLCGPHSHVGKNDLLWHLGALRLRYYPNSQRLLLW